MISQGRNVQMQQHEIHDFLESYFEANDCDILDNQHGYLTVQLTIDLDKTLMNRPFYWHYLEKTGGQPNPMKLTLITDQEKAPENLKGEVIHFGSPRLHQIFQSTKELATFLRMYEKANSTGGQTALQPWLGVNTKISYQCDRKKDIFLSLGLNLINGMVIDHFHNRVMSLQLTPKIPDYCFTLTPLIKPKSALVRIENIIKQVIENDDFEWAEKAKKRMQEDLDLLEHFYEELEEKPESYATERQAIIEQYNPNVNVEMINGGLFYLTQHSFTH